MNYPISKIKKQIKYMLGPLPKVREMVVSLGAQTRTSGAKITVL